MSPHSRRGGQVEVRAGSYSSPAQARISSRSGPYQRLADPTAAGGAAAASPDVRYWSLVESVDVRPISNSIIRPLA